MLELLSVSWRKGVLVWSLALHLLVLTGLWLLQGGEELGVVGVWCLGVVFLVVVDVIIVVFVVLIDICVTIIFVVVV